MFWRAFRLLAIGVVALSLGACIISKYDISTELKPEFPIKPGSYVNKEGSIIDVSKGGDRYRVLNRKSKEVLYARLFKIPEYSDYVFQFFDRKDRKIFYFYLKVTEKGFDFYDVDGLPSVVPEHVAKLLNAITDDDRRYNTVSVANEKRDTLYIIREVSRANLKMKKDEKESYERLP